VIFDRFLQPGGLFPETYEFIAYILDPGPNRLVPIWPRDLTKHEEKLVSFEPGKGATGLAFEREGVVVITGHAVSNEDHDLTPEQQERWRDHQVVVSAPIFTDTQVKIGALTAISKVNDGYFETPTGLALLRETASTLGVVLRAVGR
jgi:hypothetical protein